MTGGSASRSPDRNGWYNHALTVTFAGTDATSGIGTCTQTSYSGPDSANASVSGTCRDVAGNTSSSSNFNFQYDDTGPAVTATPARSPDSNGWYNHPLAVSFSGTDATSGLDTCSAAQNYSGPDNANASVSGSCTDRAGNSTQRSFGLSYDSTAPQVTGSSASRSPDSNGWYNHAFTVTFTGADAMSGIGTCTQTTYSGPDDPTGTVNGTCQDRAGNTSASSAFNFQYDATGPVVDGHSESRSRFERVVQPRAHGRLCGHGRDLRNGELCRPAGLLGPRWAERLRFGLLLRPGWKHDGPGVLPQLRLDGAGGDRA